MKKMLLATLLGLMSQCGLCQTEETENYRAFLKDDWTMQSAVTDAAAGDKISLPGFTTTAWYKVSVPTTVIAGLIANHVYNFDPFYGRNFEKLGDPRLGGQALHIKRFRRLAGLLQVRSRGNHAD